MAIVPPIPDHVPFDVIVGRKLIDRTWHLEARTSASAPMRRIETSLDERSVVPAIVDRPSTEQVQKLETMPPLTADLLEVIEPDVMTTGDVNLLISPHEDRDAQVEQRLALRLAGRPRRHHSPRALFAGNVQARSDGC